MTKTQSTIQNTEGGCLCSAIRYRVIGTPLSSIICHCNTCRKASSALSVGWLMFDRNNFELLSGNPQSFESSSGVIRKFCGKCGSGLTYQNNQSSSTIDVTTASLDNPSLFPPIREIWLEHKLPWEASNEAIDLYPRSSSEADTK
ncbi:MAG: GFA family protein [Cyanobacteria bacterium P01_A01_bin.40]